MILAKETSVGRDESIASFIRIEPCEPPRMRTVGTSFSSSRYCCAPSFSIRVSAFRIGMPVRAILFRTFFGKYSAALSKEIAIFVANFAANRFARPGFASDSWIIIGMRSSRAASTVGTLAYPPLLTITSGYKRKRTITARIIPAKVTKASVTF